MFLSPVTSECSLYLPSHDVLFCYCRFLWSCCLLALYRWQLSSLPFPEVPGPTDPPVLPLLPGGPPGTFLFVVVGTVPAPRDLAGWNRWLYRLLASTTGTNTSAGLNEYSIDACPEQTLIIAHRLLYNRITNWWYVYVHLVWSDTQSFIHKGARVHATSKYSAKQL